MPRDTPAQSAASASVDITPALVHAGLQRARYLTTPRVETVLHLALVLEKPLLIEGPAGAGKTEIGKVLAETLDTSLIRLQCYEGLDEAKALFEWNYQKQLLRIQADQARDLEWGEVTQHIFSREYLLERPLLRAITAPRKVVLLIDEIDKADEEFEAFLLEVLSEFQVTVPELGTITARQRPVVVLTSNRVRELSEALKRRCLYLYLDFPGVEIEREIVRLKVPQLAERLQTQVARFVDGLRKLDLKKAPSIAETLDWARALLALGVTELDAAQVRQTLNVILKDADDIHTAEGKVASLLSAASRP
jgi:MoxR-like ATPase